MDIETARGSRWPKNASRNPACKQVGLRTVKHPFAMPLFDNSIRWKTDAQARPRAASRCCAQAVPLPAHDGRAAFPRQKISPTVLSVLLTK